MTCTFPCRNKAPGILIAIDGRYSSKYSLAFKTVCHLQCQLIPALVENSDRHTLDLGRDGISEQDDQDDGHEQEDHCRACVPENVIELLSNKGYELISSFILLSLLFEPMAWKTWFIFVVLKFPLQGGGTVLTLRSFPSTMMETRLQYSASSI